MRVKLSFERKKRQMLIQQHDVKTTIEKKSFFLLKNANNRVTVTLMFLMEQHSLGVRTKRLLVNTENKECQVSDIFTLNLENCLYICSWIPLSILDSDDDVLPQLFLFCLLLLNKNRRESNKIGSDDWDWSAIRCCSCREGTEDVSSLSTWLSQQKCVICVKESIDLGSQESQRKSSEFSSPRSHSWQQE
jgi:hypothetical protein